MFVLQESTAVQELEIDLDDDCQNLDSGQQQTSPPSHPDDSAAVHDLTGTKTVEYLHPIARIINSANHVIA